MKTRQKIDFKKALALLVPALLLSAAPALAQYDAPPALAPGALDNLVNRIALYPDPLLAQVLAASTYSDQIQDAARFADDNRGLRGDALADTIARADLPFDPSVQALIPFPDVLDMMAGDIGWTSTLGNAVLDQRADVMDAVQRMRRLAQSYGYLQTGPEVRVVSDPGYIQILPVSPTFIWVPVYNPYVVFAPPRPGFFVGGAIAFHNGFVIGATFANWGWGGGFDWRVHGLVVNHVAWNRTWVNRATYVHNFGNWDSGHWRRESAHSVTVNNFHVNNNNVTVNRNATVNRNTTVNNREVNRTNNNFVRTNESNNFTRTNQSNNFVRSSQPNNFVRSNTSNNFVASPRTEQRPAARAEAPKPEAHREPANQARESRGQGRRGR